MKYWLSLFAALLPLCVHGETIPIIDTHAHLDHSGNSGYFAPALANGIADMDRAGVTRAILMPPPQPPGFRAGYDSDALRFAAREQPARIALAGGGGSLNPLIHGTPADRVSEDDRRRFRARAEALLAEGIVAFGEIAIHHVSHARMGPNHPYESVAADHPLLLLLADIAAERGVPIDLHFDFVPEDMALPPGGFNPSMPATLAANLPAFERLLAHNRKAVIFWAHAGADPLRTRTVEVQRALLGRHPNLFMSLRIGRGGPHPAFAVGEDGRLKPDWQALLEEFPDRYTIGSDSFHPPFANSRRTPAEALDTTRGMIGQLSPAAGKAIAHGNARRLYRLP